MDEILQQAETVIFENEGEKTNIGPMRISLTKQIMIL